MKLDVARAEGRIAGLATLYLPRGGQRAALPVVDDLPDHVHPKVWDVRQFAEKRVQDDGVGVWV